MFKLPNKIIEGIADYRSSLNEYLSGRINYSRFTGVRVPWGIYSHRGGKIFMSRIRIPAGVVSAKQLKAIAYVARAFGNGIAHITTRQDIQIHAVKIKDTIKIIEYLKDYELSPRGGGGNTVRNITSCVFSGICKDECFNVRPYAIALSEYLLSDESSFNLPRKFKISFSGCAKDCAGVLVNDIGLLACEKDNLKGFKVFAAGGMGSEPRLGKLLEEFIPEEDLGYCALALKNIFYKNGDRRNKHHNRLRFLAEDLGFEKFKKLYEDEVNGLKEKDYITLRKIEGPAITETSGVIPKNSDKEFNEFLKYNTYEQKQVGLVSIELRIPRGDISDEELEYLASLEDKFSGIEFRTSQNQNLIVCNLTKSKVYEFFLRLKNSLNDFLYPATVLDVVCCKGALTCNLGLCNSPGLTEEVEKVIKDNLLGTTAFGKINIKINGCPNACGQHPIGMVSLHGAVRRVGERPVPFYRLHLGGRKELLQSRFAKDTGILIPARNVPLFLRDFIKAINADIKEDTDIYRYIDAKGPGLAGQIADKYAYVPGYSENRDFYIDWGKTEEFSLSGLGPGECGAGVLDMVQADLTDAKIALEKAQEYNYAPEETKRALFFTARSLLVLRGVDPKEPEEAFSEFMDKFIKTDIASKKFSNIKDVFAGLKDGLRPEEKEEAFIYAKDFLAHINQLYKAMDSAFNFPKQAGQDKPVEPQAQHKALDLKGTACPINYVKAKMFLENLAIGDIVDILLDEGEPINNVPKSLESDGQKIIAIEKQDGFYKVVVEKKV